MSKAREREREKREERERAYSRLVGFEGGSCRKKSKVNFSQ